MHRIVVKQIGHRRLDLRHWAVATALMVGVTATPAGAVTNQEPMNLVDAIEAAKSATVEKRGPVHDPWSAEEPRRSCGWWTLEGQESVGGAQHALLCAPPAPAADLGGA